MTTQAVNPAPEYFEPPAPPRVDEASGEVVEEDEYFDSYAFNETYRWYLPDKKQYIEFRQMNEGDKLNYERQTNRDLKVDQKTKLAHFRVDQGSDRHVLIRLVVSGWFLMSKNPKSGRWEQMSFNGAMLEGWLRVTSPKLVSDLHAEIIRKNPGVLGDDMTIEDMEEEIANLREMIDEKKNEEAGKG